MYRVLDLFAGAGGMSLGFVQTGKFEIAVAVEKNVNAKETYMKNHVNTVMLSDILEITDYASFLREHGDFDVVVGGPPCQGFSNANRQKNSIISQNNALVKKYVEVILNLRPKAFVMENVRMLKSEIHRFYCSRNDGFEFDRLGISTRNETIALLENECPIYDMDEYIFNTEKMNELILPEKVFYILRMFLKNSNNEKLREQQLMKKARQCIKAIALLPARSLDISRVYVDFEQQALNAFIQFAGEEISFEEAEPLMTAYIKVQRMMMHAKELMDNYIITQSLRMDYSGVYVDVKSYSVIDYISKRLGELYHICDDVLNAAWYGAPQLRERYIAVGLRKDFGVQPELPIAEYRSENYHTVFDAIKDIESVETSFSTIDPPVALNDDFISTALTSQLRNSNVLTNNITTETREKAKKRFEALKQGENFHDLDRSLIEDTYTRPERTQNSIYLRLEYGKPSGTVTNVRKSMWIHPVHNRAISIREAARLQTFPDSFQFVGTKDSQYQQVGNAVPPIMAKAIATKLAELLDTCISEENEEGGIVHGGFVDNRATAKDDVKNPIEEHSARNDCEEVFA